MSSTLATQPHGSRKKIVTVFSILGVIVFGLFGWWLYNQTRTYPLGDKVEYIGKKDYGCYISFTICDSSPSSTYYYATDMTPDELIKYFKKTQLEDTPRTVGTTTDFTLIMDNELVTIYYYTDKKDIYERYSLTHTSSKKNVFSISRNDYLAAVNSLK